MWLTIPVVIASEAKQSSATRKELDCFVAEPVPGRRVAPIRVLLAMTEIHRHSSRFLQRRGSWGARLTVP
jgi:hypothetical protein